MNTNYEYKVSMLEFCSVYGCYYLCWQRNVGFLRFVLIWITKGSISKAMAFYFTENEPLPIPWYGEDVLPIAPKSGFPKRFAFFKKFAFVFLTGNKYGGHLYLFPPPFPFLTEAFIGHQQQQTAPNLTNQNGKLTIFSSPSFSGRSGPNRSIRFLDVFHQQPSFLPILVPNLITMHSHLISSTIGLKIALDMFPVYQ